MKKQKLLNALHSSFVSRSLSLLFVLSFSVLQANAQVFKTEEVEQFSIEKYGDDWVEQAQYLTEFIELDKNNIVLPSYDNSARQVPGHMAVDPKTTFSDTRLPFTEEQVKAEANRCLSCGATTVDENRCIGCGLCTTRCEFDAIHLSRDLPGATHMIRCEDKFGPIGAYAVKRTGKILFGKKD